MKKKKIKSEEEIYKERLKGFHESAAIGTGAAVGSALGGVGGFLPGFVPIVGPFITAGSVYTGGTIGAYAGGKAGQAFNRHYFKEKHNPGSTPKRIVSNAAQFLGTHAAGTAGGVVGGIVAGVPTLGVLSVPGAAVGYGLSARFANKKIRDAADYIFEDETKMMRKKSSFVANLAMRGARFAAPRMGRMAVNAAPGAGRMAMRAAPHLARHVVSGTQFGQLMPLVGQKTPMSRTIVNKYNAIQGQANMSAATRSGHYVEDPNKQASQEETEMNKFANFRTFAGGATALAAPVILPMAFGGAVDLARKGYDAARAEMTYRKVLKENPGLRNKASREAFTVLRDFSPGMAKNKVVLRDHLKRTQHMDSVPYEMVGDISGTQRTLDERSYARQGIQTSMGTLGRIDLAPYVVPDQGHALRERQFELDKLKFDHSKTDAQKKLEMSEKDFQLKQQQVGAQQGYWSQDINVKQQGMAQQARQFGQSLDQQNRHFTQNFDLSRAQAENANHWQNEAAMMARRKDERDLFGMANPAGKGGKRPGMYQQSYVPNTPPATNQLPKRAELDKTASELEALMAMYD